MAEAPKYRVLPNGVDPSGDRYCRKLDAPPDPKPGFGWGFLVFWFFCGGCLAYVPVAFLAEGLLAVFGVAKPLRSELSAVLALGAWTAIPMLFILQRRRERRVWDERAQHQEEAEAANVAAEALDLRRSAMLLVPELTEILARTDDWLEQTETWYQERNYTHFWDGVEEATMCLLKFAERLRQFPSAGARYAFILSGRRHNLPPFPSLRPEDIPRPGPAIQRLRALVHRGQTDFNLASIWEHRRTRDVLVAGFSSIGEAVAEVGQRVSAEMAEIAELLRDR